MINFNKKYIIQLTGIYIALSVAGLCSYNFDTLWGPVRKRGFHCSDVSPKKPYLKDTVSNSDLYIIGVFVPIAVIVFCELIHNYIQRKPGNESRYWFTKFICKTTIILTTFLFGLAVERLLKNIAKYKMGRLRPYFLTVCDPVDLNGCSCDQPTTKFLEDYDCLSTYYTSDVIEGSRLSFPSGHSSLAFYGMVFLASYLQRYYRNQLPSKTSIAIFLPVIQISCLFVAWCVAMTRVLDYKQYWTDVIGGLVCGSSVALAMSLYLNYQRGNIKNVTECILRPGSASAHASSSKFLAVNKISQDHICTVESGSDENLRQN